jgi:GxxExxY protein
VVGSAINRKDAKTQRRKGRKVHEDARSAVLIDAALSVHRALGPGLLESVYSAAMALELSTRGIAFEAEWPVQANYLGRPLGVAFRADTLVEEKVLLEFKSVNAIEPVHLAQVLTYLRLGDKRLGLPINFNSPLIKDGIRRVVNAL